MLAAGVHRHHLPESENEREATLMRDTIARCHADGHLLVFFPGISPPPDRRSDHFRQAAAGVAVRLFL
jgi:hypothetical protein